MCQKFVCLISLLYYISVKENLAIRFYSGKEKRLTWGGGGGRCDMVKKSNSLLLDLYLAWFIFCRFKYLF